MVDEALARFGRLDLLDNNVGIGGRGSVVDTPVADWRRIMQVNVDSMFLVLALRDPGDDRDRGRRRHRQRVVDLGPAPARAHRLFDLEGRRHRADPGDGGRSRPAGHPGQLRRAGPDLHAAHVHGADEPRPAARRGARRRCSASRGLAGTSVMRCVSCCRPRRATSPARRWSSTAARASSARAARQVDGICKRKRHLKYMRGEETIYERFGVLSLEWLPGAFRSRGEAWGRVMP